MKKVLLLGGAGFIGYNITKFLTEKKGYEITIADNFARGKLDNVLQSLVNEYSIKIIEGDFTLAESFSKLESEYDYVYMLASVVGVENANKFPHEIIRINTALIYSTLEWIKKSKIGKVLFTSTSECYAGTIEAFGYQIPTPENVPLCIEDITHPRYTYAVTKMLGESAFLNYAKYCGFDVVIVRYHNVYGPRMGFKHVIPNLVQRFLREENPFLMYGYDQTRSFNFISDAVEGTVLAMESTASNGQIFHIGSDEEITIEELIQETARLLKYNGAFENAPTFAGSVSRRCPDITKAKEVFGYSPKISWKDGLKITVSWYEQYLKSGNLVYE